MAVRRPPPGRGRPPPARGRPPPRGRGAPPPEEEEEIELPPQPPLWERLILSRSFKFVAVGVFALAFVGLLMATVGPAAVLAGAATGAGFAGRQVGRVAQVGSIAVAGAINDEGRRLWSETATPLPTPEPPPTPEPSPTPFPTAAPPRRVVNLTPPPSKPLAPSAPKVKPEQAFLPVDDAVNSMGEYFQVLATGDVRRALQYWSPDSAPEARSALDAAIARGEKYSVKKMTPTPMPAVGGVDIAVDLDVTDATGKTTTSQQRYQLRYVDNQWFITTRLQ